MDIKKILELAGWLTAIMLFVYASHAALAQPLSSAPVSPAAIHQSLSR